MSETQDILKKQWDILPQDIRDAITSTQVKKAFQAIANEHSLRVDQAGKFEDNTVLLLLGLFSTREYLGALAQDLEISKSEAEIIARDVDAKILSPIRNSMKEIQKALEEADEKAGTLQKKNLEEELRLDLTPQKVVTQEPKEGVIPNLRTMPKDVAKLKLRESIRMPKEEIEMHYKGEQGGGRTTDPYREKPE